VTRHDEAGRLFGEIDRGGLVRRRRSVLLRENAAAVVGGHRGCRRRCGLSGRHPVEMVTEAAYSDIRIVVGPLVLAMVVMPTTVGRQTSQLLPNRPLILSN
jgi:hypothetical protein